MAATEDAAREAASPPPPPPRQRSMAMPARRAPVARSDRRRALAARLGAALRSRLAQPLAEDDPLQRAGVAFIAWLAICLTLAAAALTAAVSPWQYRLASAEDGVIENLTAAACVLAALALSAAAHGRQGFPRLALAALAVGMAALAGEEISWGQRLLGFATPDFLSQNGQHDASFHRLPPFGGYSSKAGHVVILLSCAVAVAGALSRKDALFGVPLPSLPLALGGLAAVMWLPGLRGLDDALAYWPEFAAQPENVLLLTVLACAALAGRWRLLLAVAATLTLRVALGNVSHHMDSPRLAAGWMRGGWRWAPAWLANDAPDDIVASVMQLRRQELAPVPVATAKASSPSNRTTKTDICSNTTEEIAFVLRTEARLTVRQAAERLAAELARGKAEEGAIGEIPAYSKESFQAYIAKLLKHTSPQMLLHLAHRIRDSIVERQTSAWPLRTGAN